MTPEQKQQLADRLFPGKDWEQTIRRLAFIEGLGERDAEIERLRKVLLKLDNDCENMFLGWPAAEVVPGMRATINKALTKKQ